MPSLAVFCAEVLVPCGAYNSNLLPRLRMAIDMHPLLPQEGGAVLYDIMASCLKLFRQGRPDCSNPVDAAEPCCSGLRRMHRQMTAFTDLLRCTMRLRFILWSHGRISSPSKSCLHADSKGLVCAACPCGHDSFTCPNSYPAMCSQAAALGRDSAT